MHNYITNYQAPKSFDTIVSSSGSLWSVSCQDTQVFQMQMWVIQFIIKMFHIGFMQVLVYIYYRLYISLAHILTSIVTTKRF